MASNWSAERLLSEFPAFATDAENLQLTSEMVYRSAFADDAVLKPLLPAAELLAAKADWPVLYDVATLASNTVPVAAAVYDEDLYVERNLSLETANAIQGIRLWTTNEYDHNGIGVAGKRIFTKLLELSKTPE